MLKQPTLIIFMEKSLKYVKHKFDNKFKNLINSNYPIPYHITEKTGITNEIVSNQPRFKEIAGDLMHFIGDSILIGHYVHFDVNFLYGNLLKCDYILDNDTVDTLRLSRISIKETENHKLKTLCDKFNLPIPTHRAEPYVIATKHLYDLIHNMHQDNPNILESFINHRWKRSKSQTANLNIIESELDPNEIDKTTPFYNKNVSFTGRIEFLTKIEAAQVIANLGGKPQNNVTRSTNFLILGDLKYQHKQYGDKSSKHKKAEQLQKEGFVIEIMTEITFLEMIYEEIFN